MTAFYYIIQFNARNFASSLTIGIYPITGKDTICHEHCANNPSGKDELSFAEIKFISHTYFADLSGPPTPCMIFVNITTS